MAQCCALNTEGAIARYIFAFFLHKSLCSFVGVRGCFKVQDVYIFNFFFPLKLIFQNGIHLLRKNRDLCRLRLQRLCIKSKTCTNIGHKCLKQSFNQIFWYSPGRGTHKYSSTKSRVSSISRVPKSRVESSSECLKNSE